MHGDTSWHRACAALMTSGEPFQEGTYLSTRAALTQPCQVTWWKARLGGSLKPDWVG